MKPDGVVEILDLLEGAGIACWVDGGWGVDALAGRQTRPHSDLDLAVDRTRLPDVRSILEGLGLHVDEAAEPGLPARLVMVDGTRQVDLHPLKFGGGDGWQQLSESGDDWGRYPAEGLAGEGSIGGRPVRCLTAELQLRFHEGYELSTKDEHDIEILRGILSRP